MARMLITTIRLNSVNSTNTYAKQYAKTFARDTITCIVADEQTAGRGRFQRSWLSPPGVNLYTTFFFRLNKDALHLSSLAQVMAASLASVLLKDGLHPKIKWPNDVLLGNKKLSGVLCETVFHGDEVEVILGVGVNVNMPEQELAQVGQPATSLKVHTGHSWDRAALLAKLQTQFAHDLELFQAKGFAPFHAMFENLLAYKGDTVRVFDGKETWEGVCHSLTMDGQLNLWMPDHTMRAVRAGDLQTYE